MDVDIDVDIDNEVDTKEIKGSRNMVWKTPPLGVGVFTSQQQFSNQHFFLHNFNKKNLTTTNSSLHAEDNIVITTKSRHTASIASITSPTAIPALPAKPIPTITKNVKVLILGNAKCGKSSLINRYCHGTFSEKYKTTIGADFIRKDISYQYPCNKETAEPVGVRLQVGIICMHAYVPLCSYMLYYAMLVAL
jgi:hypothetical protein